MGGKREAWFVGGTPRFGAEGQGVLVELRGQRWWVGFVTHPQHRPGISNFEPGGVRAGMGCEKKGHLSALPEPRAREEVGCLVAKCLIPRCGEHPRLSVETRAQPGQQQGESTMRNTRWARPLVLSLGEQWNPWWQWTGLWPGAGI